MADVISIPFHAIVRVRTADSKKARISGCLGYVAGKTDEPGDDGKLEYGVFIYDLARVWCCREAELEVVGGFDQNAIRASELQRLRLAAKNAG